MSSLSGAGLPASTQGAGHVASNYENVIFASPSGDEFRSATRTFCADTRQHAMDGPLTAMNAPTRPLEIDLHQYSLGSRSLLLGQSDRLAMSMNRTRNAARRLLLVGALCLFAFARVALAGELCALGAGGCMPAHVGGHAHDHGHQGDVCAVETASSQHVGTAAATAETLHALPQRLDVALSVSESLAAPQPLYVRRVADAASLLVTSGRLRL
jgi:hypothetical protein